MLRRFAPWFALLMVAGLIIAAHAATQPPQRPAASAEAQLPNCAAGQALAKVSGTVQCVAMPDVSNLATKDSVAQAAAAASAAQSAVAAAPSIPTCSAGQLLTRLGASISCAAPAQPDLSGLQTKTEATAAAASVASTYQTKAASPVPCSTVPGMDTLNGAAGSGACFQRGDSARPTVTQAAIVMANASGVFSVTWAKAFASDTPYLTAQPINPSDVQPYICNISSSTTTTASGKCWKTQPTTLGGTLAVLIGAVINPTASTGAIQVRVVGRDPTQ